ncbi:restriction endonuclease subunit S [Aeromonas veronii]|uniref:Restriction endonuclease subunit S n=1 Tax=Aeromonas veronii TaxID=654 RepID=A0A3A9IJ85_AERVE|nr:restriction endonuclease subunit S [Aeromonas veronii]QIF45311.1 restriction endonuclease subunit S [Aeromonas veronii]QNF13379.1 restriction endonuclease subunit S [Aeromonas jandaei]RKJ89239.1 restriction endonuclease subunit S [Aeromonas veronii]UUM67626.1 restriction endonuclease subunit S [Aeromonas veronii]
MCSEWPLIPLRDFVDLLAGFAFKSTGYSDGQDDVRLLRGDNIAPGRVRWDGVKRWSRENAVGLERYALEPGDVVLAMDRPWIPAGLKVAQVQAADTPSYLVQRVARIRPASREDCSFLFALLSTPEFESYIQNVTTGTAVPHISAKQILDFEFRLPPAYVRAKVGEIVAALNERITLLRETNTTLEAMAQALFKSWFVDFDPVHARARGEQPAGLAPELAALFPDSFEESALGLVPKGWKYVSLKEATDIFDSKRIPLAGQERAKRKGPYPYYGAAALMDWVDDYIFDGVYLLMGEDGSVADASGYPITQYVWGKIWVNNHAHVLQGRNGISTEHLMLALKGVNIQPFITGAVQAKLSQSNMWRIQFLMPTQSVASAFADLISPMFAKIRANSEQAQTLANLRDTLLPRLISGQLRLPDAEAQLSEVGLCQ